LKDRFDNGRPVQVNARAVFDHCTVDPWKLSFSKGDEILVLEPRDDKWFLGRRQDASGLLPIDFVQFSVEDIADIVGTCKAFFMDLPNSLIPKLQYDSLIKAAGSLKSTLVLLLVQLTAIDRNGISWRPP
jgi:SH3 domain